MFMSFLHFPDFVYLIGSDRTIGKTVSDFLLPGIRPMSSTVKCLECGFQVPAGKRVCPTCLAPQLTNRKGAIALGVGLFALVLVAWIIMQLFGK